jgi:transposase, IS30 family
VGCRRPGSARRVLFDLVCGGMVMERAATAVGVSSRTGYRWWSQAGSVALKVGRGGGGLVRPGNPDTRDGPRHRLSLNERIAIMRLVDQGVSQADVARRIGRSPATVCRELKRNRNADGDYHAAMAHARAAERACRPKRFKLVDHPLTGQISEWLEQGWSPKLISTWLAQRFPGDTLRQVSHETIYQCLYVQTRGSLRADLWKQLSTRRAARKPRNRVERRGKPYAEAFTIAQRSPEADDRAVPGHWEGDLIIGAGGGSAIGTLVERTSRFTLLLHLPGGHDADTVAQAMIEVMKDLPGHLRRSLTWDRGSELTKYKDIQLALDLPVYFCDPHSPWQRGSNENTNRLLRHWFVKGTDLNTHTAAELRRVQTLLNSRPRPKLGLQTPAQRLAELLEKPTDVATAT